MRHNAQTNYPETLDSWALYIKNNPNDYQARSVLANALPFMLEKVSSENGMYAFKLAAFYAEGSANWKGLMKEAVMKGSTNAMLKMTEYHFSHPKGNPAEAMQYAQAIQESGDRFICDEVVHLLARQKSLQSIRAIKSVSLAELGMFSVSAKTKEIDELSSQSTATPAAPAA